MHRFSGASMLLLLLLLLPLDLPAETLQLLSSCQSATRYGSFLACFHIISNRFSASPQIFDELTASKDKENARGEAPHSKASAVASGVPRRTRPSGGSGSGGSGGSKKSATDSKSINLADKRLPAPPHIAVSVDAILGAGSYTVVFR